VTNMVVSPSTNGFILTQPRSLQNTRAHTPAADIQLSSSFVHSRDWGQLDFTEPVNTLSTPGRDTLEETSWDPSQVTSLHTPRRPIFQPLQNSGSMQQVCVSVPIATTYLTQPHAPMGEATATASRALDARTTSTNPLTCDALTNHLTTLRSATSTQQYTAKHYNAPTATQAAIAVASRAHDAHTNQHTTRLAK